MPRWGRYTEVGSTLPSGQNYRIQQKEGLDGSDVVEISRTVQDGEFISIVGKSGSGKSTLLNVLGCLDKGSRGMYQVDGRNVFSLSPTQLSKVRNQYFGFIFQDFSLIPEYTALENIQLPLFYRGLSGRRSRSQAAGMLERLGLEKHAKKYPSQLSGGQQQRVAIARALVTDPPA